MKKNYRYIVMGNSIEECEANLQAMKDTEAMAKAFNCMGGWGTSEGIGLCEDSAEVKAVAKYYGL